MTGQGTEAAPSRRGRPIEMPEPESQSATGRARQDGPVDPEPRDTQASHGDEVGPAPGPVLPSVAQVRLPGGIDEAPRQPRLRDEVAVPARDGAARRHEQDSRGRQAGGAAHGSEGEVPRQPDDSGAEENEQQSDAEQ